MLSHLFFSYSSPLSQCISLYNYLLLTVLPIFTESLTDANTWSYFFSIGCVILYTGQEKFHNSTSKALTFVVDTANSTGEKLRDVSEYLGAAKKIQVDQVYLTTNVQTDIDQIQKKINSSATTLTEKAVDNSDDIHDIVDSV